MRGNEYQKLALRTANTKDKTELVLNGVLGLCGESGEVADAVKKWQFQGHDLNKKELANEIGDIMWYCSILAEGLGYKLDAVMEMNIDKLKKRYPQGFDINRSKFREE